MFGTGKWLRGRSRNAGLFTSGYPPNPRHPSDVCIHGDTSIALLLVFFNQSHARVEEAFHRHDAHGQGDEPHGDGDGDER